MSSQTLNPLPLPYGDPIIVLRDRKKFPRWQDEDPNEGHIAQKFLEYLDRNSSNIAASSQRINTVSLEDQLASISATDFSGAALAAGFYEVLIYASVVQAATTSSSLQVDIDFTDNTQTKTIPGTALTANTTGSCIAVVLPIHVDNSSPVRYAVTYASVGATVMKYDLRLVLRRVDA